MDNEKVRPTEYFPDGTPIDDWFYETRLPELSELGKPYVLTEYGIWDDGKIYTKEIQKVIDGIPLLQTGSEPLCFCRSNVKGQ